MAIFIRPTDLFRDPLFQHELWKSSQRLNQGPIVDDAGVGNENGWTGMPTIADEVFTGLHRLNLKSSSDFIEIRPDVTVHAKLLTGGVLPLAVTLASEPVFEAFLSDDKADALLHGHSYTAHAVGCEVALESLQKLETAIANSGHFQRNWSKTHTPRTENIAAAAPGSTSEHVWQIRRPTAEAAESTSSEESPIGGNATAKKGAKGALWSMWSRDFVTSVSHRSHVNGTFALGSVLAIELKDAHGAGYTSTASIGVRDRLMTLGAETGQSVHCRVLGNVLYFMCSLTTKKETLQSVEQMIGRALDEEYKTGSQA